MNLRTFIYYISILHLVAFYSCMEAGKKEIYEIDKVASSSKGMVVTAHPLATQAGVEILRKGGNAADAAIAVQFALAVVYPRAGNIGGGGFLVYRDSLGEIFTLDYREKAPAKAYRNMFLDSLGNIIPDLSREGILSAGVPGTVAGLAETHRKLGELEWSILVQPAIAFAQNGFKLTRAEADRLNHYRELFIKHNPHSIPFIADELWEEGDILVQKELASTLERIAEEGADGFYKGKNAENLLAITDFHRGLITQEDLQDYTAVWREPVSVGWRNYEIHSMGLPSSGGIILAQILQMIEGKLHDSLDHHHPDNVHLIVEAERRAYADRALYLGDSEFYYVPVDSLLSEPYLQRRFQDYDPARASFSGSIDSAYFHFTKESYETTHLSVVDKAGNAASVTTTLNDNYGSKIWVPGGGYFLNNEMDDFSAKPGEPNLYGLIGAEANAIEPGKRMLSTMTPTIVEQSGKLMMVLGTPGGSTIATSVLQVFLNYTVFGMDLYQSVETKRYHHQWLPDEIIFEKGAFSKNVIDSLNHLGHHLREVEVIGLIEAISYENGIYQGAADPRGDDHAAGL